MTPDLIATYNHGQMAGHGFARLLLIVAIWDAIWKGIALRKAGTKKHLVWFIALFILNTAGILPIIYLLWYTANNKLEKQAEQAISKFAKKVEHQAEEIIDDAEESIEETVKKVEKLLKKAPIIGKKPAAKKTPANKKPVAKKN